MKVYLIGAGPGDPGLFTLKGKEALGKSNVVIYDALASPALLAYAKPDAELIYVGKVAGKHALPQAEINALLASKAREKGIVARLKGGDPYIFGRGGEEGEFLAANAIPFEEIPGISSAIAAPAYAGIPLTHRDYVSAVTIITGHERPDKDSSSHDWQAYVKSGATLVFLMGMRNLAAICDHLIGAGMKPSMPGAVIYRGTTSRQISVFAPLNELAAKTAQAGLSNPAVTVIGKVAGLQARLDWFSKKPLLGKTIVVTRAREQASEMTRALQDLGANVLECPTIQIKPMPNKAQADAALARLENYSWLIFTSVNGVKYFWQILEQAGKDSRALAGVRIAAIGPATAQALELRGISPDLVPPSYVAESVVEELTKTGALAGKRILLPRAAKARDVLPDGLAAVGAIVDILPLYQTIPANGCLEELNQLLEQEQLDCIAFGSSSTVENLLAALPAEKIKAHPELKLAAIGPVTAKTLQKYGLNPEIKPEHFTIPDLVEAIAAYFAIKKAQA